MFDKRLEINHQIHNLVADAFNTLVNKYDVSKDDITELHETLAEVDKLVERKDNLAVSEQPTKPTSREIIQALLGKGNKYVPCWVSDRDENPTHINMWVCICFVKDIKHDGCFLDANDDTWKYATPFSLETGQPITEMPE